MPGSLSVAEIDLFGFVFLRMTYLTRIQTTLSLMLKNTSNKVKMPMPVHRAAIKRHTGSQKNLSSQLNVQFWLTQYQHPVKIMKSAVLFTGFNSYGFKYNLKLKVTIHTLVCWRIKPKTKAGPFFFFFLKLLKCCMCIRG